MEIDESSDLLNAIGQHVADIIGKIPEDVYVYIEVMDDMLTAAIFENLDDEVIYYDPNMEMIEDIQSLWDAAPDGQKWFIMHYDIKDGQFAAEYVYPEEVDEEASSADLRREALIARYGDKPVIYPPPEEGDWHELTLDDFDEIDESGQDWEDGEPLPGE